MKPILFVSALLVLLSVPAYGQSLSDVTGLTNRLDVETGGHSFTVTVTANFDISDFEFDKDGKKLTLYASSGLENNLGEIHVPASLLSGNLTFFINDQQYFPNLHSNERISFVTVNFTGSGENKLEILGTTYLSGLTEIDEIVNIVKTSENEDSFDGSFNWTVLAALFAGILAVALFIAAKFKKRNQSAGD